VVNEVKWDGYRTLATKEGPRVKLLSRDEQGRPSFQALHHQSAHSLVYYAFDLLHLDGRDLTATRWMNPATCSRACRTAPACFDPSRYQKRQRRPSR